MIQGFEVQSCVGLVLILSEFGRVGFGFRFVIFSRGVLGGFFFRILGLSQVVYIVVVQTSQRGIVQGRNGWGLVDVCLSQYCFWSIQDEFRWFEISKVRFQRVLIICFFSLGGCVYTVVQVFYLVLGVRFIFQEFRRVVLLLVGREMFISSFWGLEEVLICVLLF